MSNYLVKDASEFASAFHSGQKRRDGSDYFLNHVVVVRNHPRLRDKSEEYHAVALLHDVLEDTDATEADLESNFMTPVIGAVVAITKVKGESYEDYLIRVKSNPIAREVKIADILSNLGDNPTDRQILKYSTALPFLLGEEV